MKYKSRRVFNRPGDAHGSTFSVYRRIRVFDDPRACELFLEAFAAASHKMEFDIWAYAIMPDHVHILISPRPEVYKMDAILSEIKSPATRMIFKNNPALRAQVLVPSSKGRIQYRLWQAGGGFDRNYHTGHHAWKFIEYVHDNPVVEGLCERPEDWPWSSAEFYSSGAEKSELLTRCPWFAS